jgi:hypothetical protein
MERPTCEPTQIEAIVVEVAIGELKMFGMDFLYGFLLLFLSRNWVLFGSNLAGIVWL